MLIVNKSYGTLIEHFTVTRRKTSNFDMCLLNLISIYHFCFIQKIFYHLKRNWPRFSLSKFCRSSIYVITIVKFSNSPIQNLINFPQRMDFCKMRRVDEIKLDKITDNFVAPTKKKLADLEDASRLNNLHFDGFQKETN